MRTDLMRQNANKAHDESLINPLINRIQALENELNSVKSSTAASVAKLTNRINALPVEVAVDEAAYSLLKARLIEDLKEVFTPLVGQ